MLGTLASLITPALKRVVDTAIEIHCLTNLRTWSIGIAVYTDDNDGWLPNNAFLINSQVANSISETDQNFKFCPEDELAMDPVIRVQKSIQHSYAFNGYFTPAPTWSYTRVNMNEIEQPSRTLGLTDSGHSGEQDYYDRLYNPESYRTNETYSNTVFVYKQKLFARHKETNSNILNMDGSGKTDLSIFYRTPTGWQNAYRNYHFMIKKSEMRASDVAQSLAEVSF